jgi:hypothetical protein
LNRNSILQIAAFIHLYKAYLTILPNFTLFKHYLFLKYQSRTNKHQVMGSVGIQARPHWDFLMLPLNSSLKGWHMQWFFCKNHEPSVPPFIGRLPEYIGSWIEDTKDVEMPIVKALANRVSELKRLTLTIASVVTNWLAH